MANPMWTKWIHASVASYLKSVAQSVPVASLVEGIEDRDQTFQEAQDRVEIRFNGPYTTNPSSGYYIAKIGINVLVTSNMGGKRKNAYMLDDLLGKFHEALDQPIPIYKLGTDENADGYQLGCLVMSNDKLGIRVLHFGQIDTNDRVRQGMVSANYQIELQG